MPLSNHGVLFVCFLSCCEEERRLDIDEKPLVVQLNWNKDDREGRFVLKNENDAVPAKVRARGLAEAVPGPPLTGGPRAHSPLRFSP